VGFVFIVRAKGNLKETREAREARWADLKELRELIERGEFHPYHAGAVKMYLSKKFNL